MHRKSNSIFTARYYQVRSCFLEKLPASALGVWKHRNLIWEVKKCGDFKWLSGLQLHQHRNQSKNSEFLLGRKALKIWHALGQFSVDWSLHRTRPKPLVRFRIILKFRWFKQVWKGFLWKTITPHINSKIKNKKMLGMRRTDQFLKLGTNPLCGPRKMSFVADSPNQNPN